MIDFNNVQIHPSLDQPLAAVPLVFFDVETTGLLPSAGDRVVEVAALRVCGEVDEARFTSLVNPQHPVSPHAYAIHGIGPDQLASAPLFAEIAGKLSKLLAGAVFVAHNAPFDSAFLAHEFQLIGRPAPSLPVLDTLVLARRLLKDHPSHSLAALARDLSFDPPTHRAEDDVAALRKLFNHLANRLAREGIRSLGEVLRFQRGLRPGQPEPPVPPLIARALGEGLKLRIVYRSRGRPQPTERTILPIELTSESGGIYLRAFCDLRNEQRSFALTRIEQIEIVEAG